MDDPNITMEEYIRLEEEKAHRRGKVYNWETATYDKIWDNEDVNDLRSVQTEFPAIVFNDMLTSEESLSCEPTVSSLNDEIDFRISFDVSDDEDCTVILDKNSFSYKIIYVNNLKTDSKNDNDKVNMPLLPSPEPMVSYFDNLDYFKDFEKEFSTIVYNDAQTSKSDLLTEPILNPQHINEFNLKYETSFSKCDEEEQNVLNFNDLFPFNIIYPNDSISDKDNDDDKVDIEHPSRDLFVKQLPDVINTDVGAYAQSTIDTAYPLNEYSVFDTGINTAYTGEWIRHIDFLTFKKKSMSWLKYLQVWKCWSLETSRDLEKEISTKLVECIFSGILCSLRAQDNDKPKDSNVVGISVVNMVDHNNSSRYNDNRGKHKYHDTKDDPHKKPKVTCWKCGKPGHLKKDCKAGNVANKSNGSGTKGSVDGSSNSLKVLELIHNDLSDMHATPSLENKKYLVIFIDDAFRFCYVYILHSKDEALDKFKVFKTEVELRQGSLIKRFRTDRGGEYIDTLYFQSVGIIYEMTTPYTLQQNGISERKNRVLKEMVNSMLSYSGLSQGFWCEAIYVEHSKAFRFYVIKPNELVAINSIIESKDAIFDENSFSSVPRPSQRSLINRTEDFGGSVVLEKVTDEVVKQPKPELRKSKRHRNLKDFRPEFQLYLIEGTRDEVSDQHFYCFNVEDDPKTFDEAMKSQDVAFWKEAINDEMDSIMGNNTWVLTNLPLSCRPLDYKWIFKRKLKVDGTVEKFKARLVIQGFKKKSGIDYFDTYALVARISTIRLLIAMALIYSLIIHQIDVKTAFLNSELNEEVYMKQPQGFIMLGNENKVCKLIKSLYGLKQTPKQWHKKFDEVVLSNGYLLNQAYKCIYSKFDKGVIICLYVDNMLIFGTDQVQVDLTKEFLLSRFSMKDMREADVILVSTHMDTSEKLMPNNGQAVSQLGYSRVIGCSIYVMTYTRHNIAFDVGKLSRHTSNHVLEGYTDASWISNTKDNSSISGWIPLWIKPTTHIPIRCDNAATLAKPYSQMYNEKSKHLGVRHSMIRELITNGVHMYLHIIPMMCLEPAEKEDEVVNFLMVNFFEKVLNMSMNKEEPPMYSNGLKSSILRTP
ncbi:zinc finger, CCHC-type containing protein [Tanacetum coccineum]